MCDEAEKMCYICLSKQASVKERIVGFPDILKQQFLSLPPDGHLLVGMRSSSHSEINLWESISQMGNFCINTTKSKVTINLLLEIVLIEILPSWVLQNQLISEVLRERWCFFFFFFENKKRRNKNLRHAATHFTRPIPLQLSRDIICTRFSSSPRRLIKVRRVPLDQLALSVAWRDISHQLTYVQLALSHIVLLCLHLPVCINHTRINLLCWREGLMKTGFSSSFLCYDMLLLGVEGLCRERHCEMRAFFSLYTYWAYQMLWWWVPGWLFCATEIENDGFWVSVIKKTN